MKTIYGNYTQGIAARPQKRTKILYGISIGLSLLLSSLPFLYYILN